MKFTASIPKIKKICTVQVTQNTHVHIHEHTCHTYFLQNCAGETLFVQCHWGHILPNSAPGLFVFFKIYHSRAQLSLFVCFVLFCLIFIVIQLQLSAFSPHPSTPPQLNPPPSPTSTLPLDFVHVSFIVVPVIPSPHCLLPTPPRLLLHCY